MCLKSEISQAVRDFNYYPFILHPLQAAAARFSCPLCFSNEFCSEEVLALHVNEHFSNECVPQGLFNF